MNLAVITCKAYSDVWPAFFGLLKRFWWEHPPVTLLTDEAAPGIPEYVTVVEAGAGAQWCDVLAKYAETADEETLVMQEDFLLSAAVRPALIREASGELRGDVGGVRVYPCPGATLAMGPRLGIIDRKALYWTSCQATIFSPKFLRWLLPQIKGRDAASFENEGSALSGKSDYMMMGWLREALPWPIEYICSAICRSRWDPTAKTLCDMHGITVDWSRRKFVGEN